MAVPNAERQGRGRRGLLDGEIEGFGIVKGVVILGVKNGGAGFEGVTGDRDRGHSAANDAVAFED